MLGVSVTNSQAQEQGSGVVLHRLVDHRHMGASLTGTEPMFPALAGGFFTLSQQGSPQIHSSIVVYTKMHIQLHQYLI